MGLQNFIDENIRFEIVFVMWTLFFWQMYLSMRQRKLMTSLETPPSSLDGLMSLEEYQKARSYALDKNIYTNYSHLCFNILHTVFILTFAHHYFWHLGIRLMKTMKTIGMRGDDRKLAGVGCMLIINTVTTIMDLRFEVYKTFLLDRKYGLNKQTPQVFIKDQLIKFAVMQAKHLPRALLLTAESLFFGKVWLICAIFTLYKPVLYPEVIAPFWEKYSPLPEGKLKEDIEALAASVDFPLYKVYIVDGSKRSSTDNYVNVYGFSKYKRIVLFDNLLKGFAKPVDGEEDRGSEDDEVVGVIARELGHWKYGHKIKKLLTEVWLETVRVKYKMPIFFVMAVLLSVLLLDYKPMYVAFGFTHTQPLFIGLTIVIMYIMYPASTLTDFLQNMISRRYELQADHFAKKLGHAEPLKRALIKMRKDSLAYPVYDSLYSCFHHNHLPLLEHLKALDKTE